MEYWMPRSLNDDGMIPMNEAPSYHRCAHQFVRLDDHQSALALKDEEIAALTKKVTNLTAWYDKIWHLARVINTHITPQG